MSDDFADMMAAAFGDLGNPQLPPKPKRPEGLQTSTKPLTLQVAWDGTNTVVEAVSVDEYGGPVIVARGTARRRKGDTRDDQVGFALATARVFRTLAENEERYVRRAQGDDE